MRAWILISVVLLSPAALSQTPPSGDCEKPAYAPAPYVQPTDEKSRELLKKQLEFLSAGADRLPDCQVNYCDIDAEQRASNEYFRRKLKGQVIPLQHQYEQEFYYRDRRARRHEETCGKLPKRENITGKPDPTEMTMQACEAIGVVCKPVKHW